MTYRIIVHFDRFHFQSHCVVCTQLQRLGFKDTFHQGSSFCVRKNVQITVHKASRWTIKRSLMLPWFRTNTTKRNVGFSMVTLQVVCLIVHLNFASSKLIRVNYHRNKRCLVSVLSMRFRFGGRSARTQNLKLVLVVVLVLQSEGR